MIDSIFLARHGETEWSLAGRHTGRSEIPLTARGQTAARALGARLRDVGLSRVWCSPRLRARQTCELADLGLAVETESDLAEWDYGDFEGRRTDEIRREWPGWNVFHDGCPGGESPVQTSERADRLIARVRAMEGKIVLFTHGHFSRVLGVRWVGLPVNEGRHLLLGAGAFCELGCEHGRAVEPAIVRWNVT